MRRHVLLYGLMAGALIALLQFVQYRWLVLTYSVEMYAAVIAALFAAVGLWLGLRLKRPRETRVEVIREVPVPMPVPAPAGPFARDAAQVAALGLTPRELEILEFIAVGLSNREIAERAFVSENTVKTHSSRVFEKLGVQRRTQAAQRARELGIVR